MDKFEASGQVEGPAFVTAVSGLPRSGTSMLMQMLAAGGMPILTDGVRVADFDNLRGYYEFEPVKGTKEDASWLRDARGKAVKLVYLHLYDLPLDYEYRVVFMNRNLDEVIASQRQMLDRRGEPGATVSANELRRVFSDQLERLRVWLANQPQFQVLYVDYQSVVENPESQASRINKFLEDRLDPQKMAKAVEPSLHRQRHKS